MTEYAQYDVLVTTLPICFHEMKKTTKNISDIKYATYSLQNWSPYRRIAIRSQGNDNMLDKENIRTLTYYLPTAS